MLDADSEVVSYDRSPVDLFRLVVWATAAAAVAFATRYLRTGTDGIEENLSSLLTVDSGNVRVALDVLLLAASVIASLVVLIIPLLTRRWRLFGYVFSANILASLAIAAVNLWVGDLDTGSAAASSPPGDLGLDLSTDVAAATQMIAAFVALAPFVSSRWRRLGMWLVAVLMVLRLAVAPGTSTHALLVLTVGTAVGSGVLLLFGRPTTQPRASSILQALTSSGIPASSIERASVDARGSVPWFAETDEGGRLFVKVLGTDQRAADLLFRIYRMLRLRNVGDERPFSSLRRTVEHEALVALAARDVGVHTPRLRAMATIGRESFLLSYDRIEGRSLDELPEEALTDEVLTGIWEQVARLRDHRIAHRDLRLANVFLTASGEPLIIDFGFSEMAVDDAMLDADLAQLLVSLALVTGVQRSTAAAISVLGPETVAGTLGRMQPAAMSGATQSSLKSRKGLLEELRQEIERSSGVEPPALEPVTRITPFAVAGLVVMVGIIYLLLPHLADLPGLFGEFRGIDLWWSMPALGATAAALVAASVVFVNSVRSRLPAGPTFVAEVATAFAGKFQPTGVGALSVKVRYLQRQGADASEADRAAGLGLLAGAVTQVALAGIFVLWVARDTGTAIVVSPRAAIVSVATVVLAGLAAMAFPSIRRSVSRTALPVAARAGEGFRSQLSNPAKLSWVFIGAAAQRLLQAAAFFYMTQTFGLTSSFAALAAVYLLGAGIAAAAPTPGGLGAVEVALIGGLMAIGVDSATAVPTVFLYRLITFWLPVLPGWAAFTWLRRSERL
jgi:undecaprenyl-diphosphatase